MTYTVRFWNPGMQVWVGREFDSLHEAEIRVKHYEAKYGRFKGYAPATILGAER